MLSPRRVKFRKQQRGRMRGVATRGNTIAFGEFALQAQECGWITSRQIEASRRAMTRYVKRGGKIWIRIFPDKPVTMRPAETRMGSGKGNPEFWVAVIKPGRILFEMGGADITPEIAKEAMRLAQYKLPVKTKFLTLADQEAAQAAAAAAPTVESCPWPVPTSPRCASFPTATSPRRSTTPVANCSPFVSSRPPAVSRTRTASRPPASSWPSC